MSELLKVEGLTKRFGGLVANDDISFTVNKGEIIGLIGPNGAGKTTLFNCITGFHKPTSGKVFFDGRDITALPPHRVSKIGIARTFQITQVFPKMTALENVMIGAFATTNSVSEAKDMAAETLSFVGLGKKMDVSGESLPPPEQRRLEIAMALSTNPSLLMLDEAMAGLNAVEIDESLEILRKLNKKGITLIIVEHVMRAVMNICKRIIVLENGRKIFDGEKEKAVNDPAVIKAYLGDVYHAEG